MDGGKNPLTTMAEWRSRGERESDTKSPHRTSNCKHCRIVACGYESVFIAKSQLSFPAWLVSFSSPLQQQPPNNAETTRTASECAYYWRSKRDFLKLSRVASKQDSKLSFPRAAFSKLSDQAPWIRPDHASPSNMPCSPLDETNGAPENQWKPFMKKSLMQMDRVLDQVHALVDSKVAKKHDATTAHEDDLIRAWKEFCRPESCSRCGADTNDKTGQDAAETETPVDSPTSTDVARGNTLGQYFCHPQIAQQLVRCCLQRLSALTPPQQDKNRAFLFVEPSCGHGQVIETLLNVLQQDQEETWMDKINLENSNFAIVGIDKDETAISHCRQKFDGSTGCLQNPSLTSNSANQEEPGRATTGLVTSTDAVPSSTSNLLMTRNVPVKFAVTDFLQSCRTDYTMIEGQRNDKDSAIEIVVVGGPPYSAGAGYRLTNKKSDTATLPKSSTENNDLPLQFLHHSIVEYQATVIAFILPQRCAKLSYHDTILPSDYEWETVTLEGPSTFFFQGRDQQAVHQPSMIQVFWKRKP